MSTHTSTLSRISSVSAFCGWCHDRRMAMTCPRCGRYGPLSRSRTERRCDRCGYTASVRAADVLIVTGAAATGKSSICDALSAEPGVLALDVDTLALGAAAVANDTRDYVGFWRYLFHIAADVIDNGITPAFCGICLPEQALAALPGDRSITLRFLALLAEADDLERRIVRRGRPHGEEAIARQQQIDERLRSEQVPSPHSLDTIEVTDRAPDDLRDAAQRWARSIVVTG